LFRPVAEPGCLPLPEAGPDPKATVIQRSSHMSLTNAMLLLASIGFLAVDNAKKDDADAIKGKWVAVTIKQGATSLPAEFVKAFKFDFDGKNYTNTGPGGQSEEGGYTLDSSKSPKTIDFDIKTGNDKGKKQLAIYKIDGDKLTIVASQAGSTDRPKSLEPEENSPELLVVLEREKP
jgi:uncharacterized protein (TIGR03067 family)